MSQVPSEYFGVWKRKLLTKSGLHDDTSLVVRTLHDTIPLSSSGYSDGSLFTYVAQYWMQTQSLHADLRIPQRVYEQRLPFLTTCSDAQLVSLASQQAFAGTTKVLILGYLSVNETFSILIHFTLSCSKIKTQIKQ